MKQGPFLDKIFPYMEEHEMIRPGGTVLAGVSGGADSMCLLLALLAYRERMAQTNGAGFSLHVIHVDHGLRGEASAGDAAYVRDFCESLAIPVSVVCADVAALAREQGLSLEEAGRMERYRIFEEYACREDARIAVAHTMDDQAETVLFHLARGSGLAGLAGMQPVRGRIIRPLLPVSRSEIETWLGAKKIAWREDETNNSASYTRNRIRQRVLPLLKEQVNAQSTRHICEAAAHVGEAARYIRIQVQKCMDACLDKQEDAVVLDVSALRGEDPLIRSCVLREAVCILRGGGGLKDIGTVHIRDMEELLWKGSGKRLDLPGRLKCVRKEKRMILYVERAKKEADCAHQL